MPDDLFSAASAGAMEDVQASDDTPEGAVTPEPTATEPPAPPSTPAADVPPAAPPTIETPLETPAAQAARMMELKYRGQPLQKTEEETIQLAQMGYDYTQKMQALAERDRLIAEREQTVQQQAQELESVLKDEAKLKQLVMWAAQQQGVQAPDPNEILTQSQVESLLQEKLNAKVAEFENATKKEIARTHFALETNRQETEFKAAFSNHVANLTEKLPILKDDSHLADDLRLYGAAYLQSRLQTEGPLAAIDQKQVFAAISQEAERRANREQGRIDNLVKAHLAKSHSVVAKGTEPPGGPPPPPVPQKQHKLGSKELHDLVMSDLSRPKD